MKKYFKKFGWYEPDNNFDIEAMIADILLFVLSVLLILFFAILIS